MAKPTGKEVARKFLNDVVKPDILKLELDMDMLISVETQYDDNESMTIILRLTTGDVALHYGLSLFRMEKADMPHGQHTTAEIIARLEVLWNKLENEGCYTKANTVALAIHEIERLRDEVNLLARAVVRQVYGGMKPTLASGWREQSQVGIAKPKAKA